MNRISSHVLPCCRYYSNFSTASCCSYYFQHLVQLPRLYVFSWNYIDILSFWPGIDQAFLLLLINVWVQEWVNYLNPLMNNVPKWSETLLKFCSKSHKIFKVCLAILKHYAFKWLNLMKVSPMNNFSLVWSKACIDIIKTIWGG